MIEMAKSTLQWVKTRYNRASAATKVGYGLVVVVLITLIVITTPFFLKFKAWFTSADPLAQSIMMMFLLISAVLSIFFQWERSYRVDQLKAEREKVEGELAGVRQDLDSAQRELAGVEERWTRLVEVGSQEIVWQRPDVRNRKTFIPKEERKTRFVSMFNLKGGVGKTTITANMAACLALMDNPLRVLVVDIDFQGTLSDLCVDPQLIEVQSANNNTVNRLLFPDVTFENLATVAVPMNQVPRAKVIIANDKLEAEDFRAQRSIFWSLRRRFGFSFSLYSTTKQFLTILNFRKYT